MKGGKMAKDCFKEDVGPPVPIPWGAKENIFFYIMIFFLIIFVIIISPIWITENMIDRFKK